MENKHSQLLAAAAKRHLAPLGLKRQGRSRTWLDDQKWFVTVVEFQLSGYSKGSFLNVGAHFLWSWNGHLSFDLGYRMEKFVSFDSEEQFSPEADRLAAHAATEVQRLQTLLIDVSCVAAALPEQSERACWPTYHRAVSLGLSGNVNEAMQAFSQLIEAPHPYPWIAERAARCLALRDLLATPQSFREAISDLIRDHRNALRLPIVTETLPLT
jgi:hypothetical protein